jgi:hypothetical protein
LKNFMLLVFRGLWIDGTSASMYMEIILRNRSIFQISTLVCLSSISICNLLIDLPLCMLKVSMYCHSLPTHSLDQGIGTKTLHALSHVCYFGSKIRCCTVGYHWFPNAERPWNSSDWWTQFQENWHFILSL